MVTSCERLFKKKKLYIYISQATKYKIKDDPESFSPLVEMDMMQKRKGFRRSHF